MHFKMLTRIGCLWFLIPWFQCHLSHKLIFDNFELQRLPNKCATLSRNCELMTLATYRYTYTKHTHQHYLDL